MATQYQRAEIIRLLRKLELDSVTLTYMHRRLGVQDYMIGTPVEGWIDTLSTEQASSVISKLRGDADEQREDEE